MPNAFAGKVLAAAEEHVARTHAAVLNALVYHRREVEQFLEAAKDTPSLGEARRLLGEVYR